MECTCGSNCGLSMPSSLSVFGGIISVIGDWVICGGYVKNGGNVRRVS